MMKKLVIALLAAAGAPWAAAALTPQNNFYSDWARFSVLTPPGPAEPRPEVFRGLGSLVQSMHMISRGESLPSIAKLYSTDVRSLQSTNRNDFIYMRPGGYIRVCNKKGLLYEVAGKRETLNYIIRKFAKNPAEREILRRGVVSENNFPAALLVADREFSKGDRIFLPGVYLKLDTYRLPVSGGMPKISSRFGYRRHPLLSGKRFHEGWDIPEPFGTPVYPARSGKVVFAGWMNGYGYVVDVEHSDRALTRYGHLSVFLVSEGQRVEKGKTMLGRVGATGLATGPHLHFEIHDSRGRPVNPSYKIGRS